jgi:AsmA protein
LKRLERRPLSGAGSFRSGSTPYDNLTVALKFADGIATTEEVKLENATTRVTLSGTIAVPNREYDLKGVASLVSAQKGDSNFDLPFVVSGPWDDPLIFPEAESLIRRSTTVAPLLDALKGGKAGDTVRSVIERLTGGGRPAAPALDAAAPAQPAAK